MACGAAGFHGALPDSRGDALMVLDVIYRKSLSVLLARHFSRERRRQGRPAATVKFYPQISQMTQVGEKKSVQSA